MTKGRGKTPGFGGLGKHYKAEAHKERSQPAARKKLGALEKKKDYKVRAGKRKERVTKMTQLKRAAALRNPDEFNVKMTQTRMDKAGKLREKGRTPRVEQAKGMLKENDTNMAYLQHKARDDRRIAEHLLHEVVGLEMAPQGKHTVFVEDEDEVAAFQPERHFNTTQRMLHTPALRGNKAVMATLPADRRKETEAAAEAARRVTRGEYDDVAGPAAAEARRLLHGDAVSGGDRAVRLNPLLREEAEGEEAEAPELSFAEKLALARSDVAKEQRTQELADRKAAAMKFREVTQRHGRAKKLEGLATTLNRQSKSLRNIVTQKAKGKFRDGATIRSR